MMDLQEIVNNKLKADRAESMKTSEQLTLGELILLFESLPNKEDPVNFDFGNFYPTYLHSWRGSYAELAFGFEDEQGKDNPPVEEILKQLKSALGKTFEGYKGGDFTMGKTTPIWVANYGKSNCTAVVGVRRLDYGWVIIDTKYIEY